MEDEKIDQWIEGAIKKGYGEFQIRKVLEKNNYKPIQIQKVLEEFKKVKSKLSFLENKKPASPVRPIEPKQIKIVTPKPKGEVQETYELDIDKAKVQISIEKTPEGLMYCLYIPEIDVGTKALLDEIRKELITVTAIGVGEIIDEKSIYRIKDKFMRDATNLIREKVPGINKESEEFLVGLLMQDMLGLGRIEFVVNDSHLEEIVIVNSNEVRVYHKKYGWLKTNIILKTEDEVVNYSNIIARRVGRQISILNPLLDAHILTGDRANAVLYPIATKGNTITIRKFSRDPWTMIDLINNGTVSKEIAAILWLAIEYEMNILFSGGTASGKTSFLNACMPFMPPNHRIISMEDTRELMLPRFLYWCPLVTRTPNAEGKGEVSMLDLLVNSLRMRPDRIILGEIRRQREAEVLFEAMHTGHSVYATVHADTANETIRRLINPPINVPPSMLTSVHLNIVMFRDRRKGSRRVLQVAEYLPGKDTLNANLIYRWIPEKDVFTEHNKSMVFFDQLSRNTGMDEIAIKKMLDRKIEIFDWLIKNKIRDLESFGKVMNLYYTYPDQLKEIIAKNMIDKITENPKDREL